MTQSFWGIEHLFGSITRTRLLRIFLINPTGNYHIRDLSRRIAIQLNAVRRELDNLKSLGIVESEATSQKKFYRLDQTNFLFPELKALFTKSQLFFEKNLGQAIDKVGQIQLLMLTGKFTGVSDSSADLLIVGRVNRDRLRKIIDLLQNDFGEQINYTVMTQKEYNYRREVSDKFLLSTLSQKKITIIDRLSS